MHIPDTPEQAVEALTGLGALLRAKEWERAALIAALVGPEVGKGRPAESLRSESFPHSTVTLAALGVIGLKSTNTVAHYRDCWYEHAGLDRPVWGADVQVPDLPWPPNLTVGDPPGRTPMDDERKQRLMAAGQEAGSRTGSKVVDVVSNVKSVIAGIKADPEFARTIMEDLDAQIALDKAEGDTERMQQHSQSMGRQRREHAAAEADSGPQVLRPGLRFIGAFFDFDAFVWGVCHDYRRDDEGAQVARDLADMLDRRATQLRAWADGEFEAMTTEEFEEGLRTLLGDDA